MVFTSCSCESFARYYADILLFVILKIIVVDGKFVKERVNFSNEFGSKTKTANDFSSRPRKGSLLTLMSILP